MRRQVRAEVPDGRDRDSERVRALLRLSERAVTRAPDRAETHLVLASYLSYLGRAEEARAALERASKLGPEAEDVRQMLELADRRRADRA
jgi:cytochrome c-type biogenesis protein CcmH/NrfG